MLLIGAALYVFVAIAIFLLTYFGAVVPALGTLVLALLLFVALYGGWVVLLVVGWLFQPTRRLMIDVARDRFPDAVTVAAVRDFDADLRGGLWSTAAWLLLPLVVGVLVGLFHRRKPWRRWWAVIAWILVPVFAVGALAASRIGAPRLARRKGASSTGLIAGDTASSDTSSHPDGGHVGFDESGTALYAPSRGALLVIGPPRTGKSSGSIIPSIWKAKGAVVVSSIKIDLLEATRTYRATRGRLWLFDLAGEEAPDGVVLARWSPLAAIHDWDSARLMATSMVEPLRAGDKGGGHFLDRAKAWTECCLFAGFLAQVDIGTVADWVAMSMSDTGMLDAHAALIDARDAGDVGAGLAARQLEGILATPEKERGGYASTMQRVFSVYQSPAARAVGRDLNFDPVAFVRSTDTLYITAADGREKEFAPLIVGLLEAIRYAQYARHRTEPGGVHLTFVLDEASNTARIPLLNIISAAGGQGLHVIVGIQDLSQARECWGKPADGLLTLFGSKLVFPGIFDTYTLTALSNAAGEYDRAMSTVTEARDRSLFESGISHSSTTQRTKILDQGDITNPGEGRALLFQGAGWQFVEIRLHYNSKEWAEYR